MTTIIRAALDALLPWLLVLGAALAVLVAAEGMTLLVVERVCSWRGGRLPHLRRLAWTWLLAGAGAGVLVVAAFLLIRQLRGPSPSSMLGTVFAVTGWTIVPAVLAAAAALIAALAIITPVVVRTARRTTVEVVEQFARRTSSPDRTSRP